MKPALYWRLRAEEIRIIRDDAKDPRARACLARIAADYDALAQWADPQDHEAIMVRLAQDYAAFTEAGHSHE